MTSDPAIPRRPDPRRARVAWTVAGVDLAVFAVSLIIWAASDVQLGLFDAATYVMLPVAFGGSGALLTARVPGNPIGPLLLAATTGFAILVGAQSYLLLDAIVAPALPAAAHVGILAGVAWVPSLLLVLIGVPLVFPDGRFLSDRWRAIPIITALLIVPVEIQSVVMAGTVNDYSDLPNPLADPALADALAPFAQLAAVLAIPLFAVTWWSQVIRYRRSDDVGRHQIRWLAASVLAAVIAFSIAFNTTDPWQAIANSIGLIAMTGIPVAIVIAIIRYRLYAIDRLISRGISYAILTVILVVAYGAVVLGMQELLGELVGRNTVPVVVSTLVVASLFQPLRGRIQSVVDRRFDRGRVDATMTAARFADRLRDELDIDAISGDLSRTVDAALRPAAAQMWLRRGP